MNLNRGNLAGEEEEVESYCLFLGSKLMTTVRNTNLFFLGFFSLYYGTA